TVISGVTFTTFEAGDAAMSHYLTTRSYRAVHQATCYAIDVLVFGTNPQVYDPPATPPFTKAQAFARLLPVARNLQFIAGPSPVAAAAPIAPHSTYKGLLPCADCPGIIYQLNLLPNHRYHLRLNYQDRAARFDEYGRWRLTDDAKKLLLQAEGAHPSAQQWAVLDGGRRLRLLDRAGQPIHSGLNYDLTRSAQFEPFAAKSAAY
ncbi:MAG TPA: copper resistance protein NlpE, partial [Nitrococcus sp.]|nr:copper resistance protein NlpE [Nitrococcus sp.]